MSLGVSGDGDEDDAAAMGLIPHDACWEPEAWHKSPDQMFDEAKAMNHAAFAMADAHAHKHCDPPNGGTDRLY
jgi:hypothetical protein